MLDKYKKECFYFHFWQILEVTKVSFKYIGSIQRNPKGQKRREIQISSNLLKEDYA